MATVAELLPELACLGSFFRVLAAMEAPRISHGPCWWHDVAKDDGTTVAGCAEEGQPLSFEPDVLF
uniref:Uncharacterized protein n=1 Tax=Oryza barthii TaxID=65489 RepID=A0A0D3GVR5_9ORYZ